MKKAVLIFAAVAAILSSCSRDQYRIHGRVIGNDLEDVQVFLVPLGHEDRENVDSVHIHNHEFFFKGTKHWMCDIRLDKRHRIKAQNLLVVTEPGDIYVTIGPDSFGGGTPQNDSLQVWKELTIEKNKMDNKFRYSGKKEQLDSMYAAYKARTRQMALNVGEESVLGAFLLGLYPLPKE